MGCNPIDPLDRATKLRGIVCRDDKRKYYRFRATRFYGGIATADCVGCFLNCAYCWSSRVRDQKPGNFYSSEEISSKLSSIAKRKKFSRVRISGNEPTLCKEHLLGVISGLAEFLFILETNGILIDEKYARALKRFSNLHVRVSLKGCDENSFSKITGARPEFFSYQLNALKHLVENGISCHPAVMGDLCSPSELTALRESLRKIDEKLERDLELEKLILYPFVKREMERRGSKINITR